MSRYEISPRRLNKADRPSEPAGPRRLDLDLLVEALHLGDDVEVAEHVDPPGLPGPSDLGLPAA